MKTSKYTKVAVIIMVILFVVISVVSCSTHVHNSNNGNQKIPPGQAKKMSGSKSAKAYAPGQQKKK
ncbi:MULTISPECIES: hypothetical protein [unclassified Flavobacterium]|uniref:hypothetical protein n=1 Tax=unclassified Flavobacterium TaxID=196869 RepID=UPI0012AA8762|nr:MULTISPECIES: hypothetical protein [unclassified Flavobacterium]MBF4484235.1 hypothetical protein [Flavobacterium sp. CSZ]QGK74779.1 hypothetical protein GIY83_12135 [Flavobacterium sp. SLB02]